MRRYLIAFITLAVVTFLGVMFLGRSPGTPSITMRKPLQQAQAPEPTQAAQSATNATDPARDASRPTQAQNETPPTIDTLRIDRDGPALLAGRAIPKSATHIFLDETRAQKLDVGTDGNFVSFFDLGLRDKPQVLTVRTLLPDGRELHSTNRILIAALKVANNDPKAPTAPDTVPEIKPIALLQTPDGISVMQAAPEQPQTGKIDEVKLETLTYAQDGAVQLSGRGGSGRFVRVYLDNKPYATQQIDDSGQWSSQLAAVAEGTYTLRVDELGDDGQVVSRVETPFRRQAPAAVAPAGQDVTAVTVQPGSTLWAISQQKYGDGTLYVRIFEANSANIANPDLIYPGQVFKLPD